MKRLIIAALITVLLPGCISLNIGAPDTVKSKNLNYKEPDKHFKGLKSSSADRAWLSQKTGNTLSFTSECGDASANIDQIYNELLSGVSQSKVVEEKREFFNERAAIKSHVTGNVDGIPVKMAFLVFKKNSCVYSISYGGVEKNFESELADYQKFLSHFKAD